MAVMTDSRSFEIVQSEGSLGRNLPQRLGRLLWLPMLLMAVMGFAAGFVVAIIRANEVADAGAIEDIEAMRHVVAGLMFIGFAAVFAAISFAIARILGEFRKGGGDVQEALGLTVETLKMPKTAKAFIAVMVMAMMTILVAVVLHFIFAADVEATEASLADSEQRFLALEAVRRFGVGMYLLSIALGLSAIIQVLRFQAVRVRELAELHQS
jgi:uncharacterized membrane protein YjgN (DUF898 family)